MDTRTVLRVSGMGEGVHGDGKTDWVHNVDWRGAGRSKAAKPAV